MSGPDLSLAERVARARGWEPAPGWGPEFSVWRHPKRLVPMALDDILDGNLAMELLEEMAAAGAVPVVAVYSQGAQVTFSNRVERMRQNGKTAHEAIAAAWLAWKEAPHA